MARSNTAEFVAKAQKIHGDRYDYTLVEYRRACEKVTIICREHGCFNIEANSHLRGRGCAKCCGGTRSSKEEFIQKARIIHGDKYDYSLVDYHRSCKKVVIICRIHGTFNIKPNDHLCNHGCAKCSGNAKSNTMDFIAKALAIHGDKYDYSRVNYRNTDAKVIVICRIHGEFLITPDSHLHERGCYKCQESRGEKAIRCFLERCMISYSPQHQFASCKKKRTLPFDFVLYYRGRKYAIEFHGKQHYCLVKGMFKKVFSSDEARKHLVDIGTRDRIKREWCKRNKIPLLVIPYHKKSMIPQLIADFIEYDPEKIDFEQIEIE